MRGLTTDFPRRAGIARTAFRILLVTIWMLSIPALDAGSATWAPNPVSGDWNTSANWVPMNIPNGPAGSATFETSTRTDISIGTLHEIGGMTFNAGASAYVISAEATTDYVYLLVSGIGITNNSGNVQNFVLDPGTAFLTSSLDFGNSATAGSGTQIDNRGGPHSPGSLSFNDASSAGSATIINGSGPPDGVGGRTLFGHTASASNATIINDAGGYGGSTLFVNNSSAGSSTIINHGATAPGSFGPGRTDFTDNATAGDANLVANGGTNGGEGGIIRLSESSTGGTARIKVFGNGNLDLRGRYNTPATIGSLAGDGKVLLGYHILAVGSNDASTSFSGTIGNGDDSNTSGGLTKIGSGTLTLSGASRFSRADIEAGTLEVTGVLQNTYVYVNEGGTLAGSGTVGNLYVNRLGLVAPGHQRTLHLDGSYEQQAGGVLKIEVAGTGPGSSDYLDIKFVARLDGTLEVRFVNGFLPRSGDVFKIFNVGFAGGTGNFARIIFPDLRAGFQFQPEFLNFTYQITALNDGEAATGLLNISTRMRVGTGDNALIGGFIITGNTPKRVVLRAIGPSLTGSGTPLPGRLADPTVELRGPAGELISFNDNWMDSSNANDIIATGLAPDDQHEAAIIATLEPGSYTAIMRGLNNTTGIGAVEAYDLSQGAMAKLDNISSRGFVESGDNVMIGGFITDNQATHVMVRALGPSLMQFGIAGALADPTVALHDGQGALIAFNDDWRDADERIIEATGIPPSNEKESAILATVAPGGYTVIVRGKDNMTGVGLVEVYNLH